MSTSCEICEQEPFKYRCPACSAQTCSLRCSRDHKQKCGGSLNVQIEAPIRNGLRQEPSAGKALDGRIEQSTDNSITSAPEVQELFVRYPKLRTQLRTIYEASLEHHHIEQRLNLHGGSNASRSRGRGYHKGPDHVHKQHWTAEKGTNSGLKRLQWDLQASDADSNGLGEFCKTIAKLQAGGSCG